MTFHTLTFRARRSTQFVASWNVATVHALALLIAASACDTGAVDVGTLPKPGDESEDPIGSGGSAGANSGPDAGGGPDPVAQCSIPGLNGHRLVFDSDEGQLASRIYSMRADGSDVVPLTSADVLAREPAVSTDGAILAYSSPEGVEFLELGSGETGLFYPGFFRPAWSPDGSRIAIAHPSRQGFLILYVTDGHVADESVQPLEVACNGDLCEHLAWSSDSSSMVSANAPGPGSGDPPFHYELRSQTVVGEFQSKSLVSPSETLVAHPTASPDGIWVAATYDCPNNDRSSLWVSPYAVTTAACEGRRVTLPDAPSVTNPSWGPGVLIAYERGEPPRDIAIIAADTGEECVIEMPGDQRNPSWMPESTFDPK